MKTRVRKTNEIERKWFLVDARGLTLGRLCSKIAIILIGKHKSDYTPHVDCGDFVVVLNADKFKVTGKKLKEKLYYSHSLYPGGIKTATLEQVLQKSPAKIIQHGVSGMLPKNRLRPKRLKRLKLFCSDTHPYTKIEFKALTI